jgi:DNA-directed RNA polymerase subunit omega
MVTGSAEASLQRHPFCRLQPMLPLIFPMRDDYLQAALKVVDDANILVNVVSTRVKQLRRGSRPLVESLEKLSPEDIALREIMEGKITYELATPEQLARR